jgi:hypothetical protein
LLVTAQGPVELKLERLDGSFGETNWGSGQSSSDYGTFNYFRYYAPVSLGVGGVESGRYRLSARQAGTSGNGQSIEVTLQNGLIVAGGGSSAPTSPTTPAPTTPAPTTPTQPVETPSAGSGTTNGQIRRIGYKYDMPTHGFQLLTDATGSVEVRLERLDGPFSASNWGATAPTTDYTNYNGFRYYAPASLGVGGVESGRYRLSARLAGDTGNGQSVEVTLGNGVFQVWSGSVGSSTPPTPAPTPAPTTPEPVVSTPTPTTPSTPYTQGTIQAIGYKYDMPTHGFQLLAQATVPVQMRLERLDGAFGPSDWSNATSTSDYPGYNYMRYYAPITMGVGGVEPGRYRLSVRKVGDTGNGQSIEVTLQNGLRQVATPNARMILTESAEEIIWQSYPNPAEQEVTVTYPASLLLENVRIQLTSVAGFTTDVPVLAAQPGKLQVTLGNAPAGLYILRVLNGTQPVQALKVIKK